MLQNILNLEGVAVLNKKQQRIVNGGLVSGTCAYTYSYTVTDYDGNSWEVTATETGVSKATALENVAGGGNWCCASCGSASWL